jgi:hypothetical protein
LIARYRLVGQAGLKLRGPAKPVKTQIDGRTLVKGPISRNIAVSFA